MRHNIGARFLPDCLPRLVCGVGTNIGAGLTALSQSRTALGFVPGEDHGEIPLKTPARHNQRARQTPTGCVSRVYRLFLLFLAALTALLFKPQHHVAVTRQCLPNTNGSPQEAASDTARCTADSGVQVPPGEIKAPRFVHFSSCDTLSLPTFSSLLQTSIFTSWHHFPYIQPPDPDRSPFPHHPPRPAVDATPPPPIPSARSHPGSPRAVGPKHPRQTGSPRPLLTSSLSAFWALDST